MVRHGVRPRYRMVPGFSCCMSAFPRCREGRPRGNGSGLVPEGRAGSSDSPWGGVPLIGMPANDVQGEVARVMHAYRQAAAYAERLRAELRERCGDEADHAPITASVDETGRPVVHLGPGLVAYPDAADCREAAARVGANKTPRSGTTDAA